MFYAFCWKEPEEEEQDSDKKVKNATERYTLKKWKTVITVLKHFRILGLGGCKVQKIEEKIKGLPQMLKSIFAWNLTQKDMTEYSFLMFKI